MRSPATQRNRRRSRSYFPIWMRPSARPRSSSTMQAIARAGRSSISILARSRSRSRCRLSADFLVGQQAVRRMLPKKHGVILFTGASASVKGYAQSAPFAMGKFALRGLAQSMARELAPQGIHVAHVVIDGAIKSARRPEPPDAGQHARSQCDRGKLPALDPPAAQRLEPGKSSCGLGSSGSDGRRPSPGICCLRAR